jgi:GNAT superfamily N-acetyltransferase
VEPGVLKITLSLVDISAARLGEADDLTRLALASKRHWGYDDAFMERCASELTVRERDVGAHRVFVARDAEQVLGFYQLEPLDETCVELDMLFVEPGFIGEGVGEALLRHAMNVAREGGASTLRIVADPYAAAFYEHVGAVLVGSSISSSTGRSLPTYELSIGESGETASIT